VVRKYVKKGEKISAEWGNTVIHFPVNGADLSGDLVKEVDEVVISDKAPAPVEGLLWFNTTNKILYVYKEGIWTPMIDEKIGDERYVNVIGDTMEGDLIMLGILDMQGGAGKWFAPPRMTTAERDAMVAKWGIAEAGRIWYNTDTNQWEGWNGTTVVILG